MRPTHPREFPPSRGRWVRMERVGGTGVPVEYLQGGRASALVHSLPASHNGCIRDTITRAAGISGSNAQ
jgi:hypothetical protein